jgi:GH15 family glucan-1,4-alpha-glucosidase
VRPFRIEALYPAARRTLRRLASDSGRFGVVPSEGWQGGDDPWTAPTAWTAWGLAALASDGRAPAAVRQRDRRAALRLIAALRRASTPAGLLPERVDADTGAPRSTTPLAWSHAFAILALRAIYRRQSRWR